jgi:hypothetical protein
MYNFAKSIFQVFFQVTRKHLQNQNKFENLLYIFLSFFYYLRTPPLTLWATTPWSPWLAPWNHCLYYLPSSFLIWEKTPPSKTLTQYVNILKCRITIFIYVNPLCHLIHLRLLLPFYELVLFIINILIICIIVFIFTPLA